MNEQSLEGLADHSVVPARRGPLEHLRVIEASSFITGPYAGLQLADLGADVVKVEPPRRGDPFRNFGRPATFVSASFANMNRGKRSAVIDLKTEPGMHALLTLLDTADVFITNWRPGVADRLGLTDASLEERNPRLIRTMITGYGPDGPYAEEPAFDTAVQARSGLMDALSADGVPRVHLGYPIDKATALRATQAILTALYERERTGLGQRIALSMLDAAVSLNFADLFTNRVFLDHEPVDPHNRHLSSIRSPPASDGAFVIAPVAAQQMKDALRAVGHPEWIDELLALPDQAAMVNALYERIASVSREVTLAEWVARFRDHDVACSPCTPMDALFSDPQVLHNQLFEFADWGEHSGRSRYVRGPAVLSRWGPLVNHRPPPRLGADTDDALAGPGE